MSDLHPAAQGTSPARMEKPLWEVGTISVRYEAAKRWLRRAKRKLGGLRVFFDPEGRDSLHGYNEAFAKGHWSVKVVLDNLERQPRDAFEVFVNLNDEIAVRQTRWLPHFHLV